MYDTDEYCRTSVLNPSTPNPEAAENGGVKSLSTGRRVPEPSSVRLYRGPAETAAISQANDVTRRE